MTTATPTTRPEFVFVRHDDAVDRPDGTLSDRERIAVHRRWLQMLDAGTMPASKVALLDRWVPGWRSDAARELFAVVVPAPRRR